VPFLSAQYTTPNPLRDLANALCVSRLVQRHPDLFFQLDGYRRPAKRSLSPRPPKPGADGLGDEDPCTRSDVADVNDFADLRWLTYLRGCFDG
jgi:hypothetical protein